MERLEINREREIQKRTTKLERDRDKETFPLRRTTKKSRRIFEGRGAL
jgi:hypothetical protein